MNELCTSAFRVKTDWVPYYTCSGQVHTPVQVKESTHTQTTPGQVKGSLHLTYSVEHEVKGLPNTYTCLGKGFPTYIR